MPTISPTRITDWENPKLPLPLRVFNAASGWPIRRFVSLEPKNLLRRAVACLEPGGVETPMMDVTEEQEAELRGSVPDHLLPEYKAHFKFPGDAIEATFPLWKERWFLPEETPAQPKTPVVKVADVVNRK